MIGCEYSITNSTDILNDSDHWKYRISDSLINLMYMPIFYKPVIFRNFYKPVIFRNFSILANLIEITLYCSLSITVILLTERSTQWVTMLFSISDGILIPINFKDFQCNSPMRVILNIS